MARIPKKRKEQLAKLADEFDSRALNALNPLYSMEATHSTPSTLPSLEKEVAASSAFQALALNIAPNMQLALVLSLVNVLFVQYKVPIRLTLVTD